MKSCANPLLYRKIILGVTGSIAAYKAPLIVRQLKAAGADVRVILTKSAQCFVTPMTLQAISGHPVHQDLFDLSQEAAMGHIELARWAELLLIAPASADSIARIAEGRADDLLGAVCLATQAPLIFAPAMNRQMWENSKTQANLAKLASNHFVLPVGYGEQACGEIGEGRMIEPEQIVDALKNNLAAGPLAGKKVVVTAGPTHEKIDPVRYLTNPSSGKMGYAMAKAAAHLGAEVILVSGPTALPPPAGITTIPVISALDMYAAVMSHIDGADIFIATAAVSDYRPTHQSAQKIKKTELRTELALTQNPDILKAVSALPNKPYCIGFAAETENVIENAQKKMQYKNLDMICVNDVSNSEIGFASDENLLSVLTATQRWDLKKESKENLAKRILALLSY